MIGQFIDDEFTCVSSVACCFFFKQKTAYEMRIIDWSSDVCSSDLPAGRADLAATFDDYVIPSGLLNGIVSGLVSRSILNDDLVGPNDFPACVSMPEHAASDVSRDFIDKVEDRKSVV